MSDIQAVASGMRLRIAIAGRCNAGKSSLLNLISGQRAALVSEIAGTTTDPVRKGAELPELGPVTLVDTAGLDDATQLGPERVCAAESEISKADIVIIAVPADNISDLSQESALAKGIRERGGKVVAVITKTDLSPEEIEVEALSRELQCEAIGVDSYNPDCRRPLLQLLARNVPADFGQRSLLGNLVNPGDLVMLVMPQDSQAPKGRLIMPQVMTIRELLDRGCIPVCCSPATMEHTLANLTAPPALVITDSQAFASVAPLVPSESRLTSFSVLMAGYKGDLGEFVKGARAVASLTPDSRILIAEACTHAPANEDIGRVKIPALLRKRIGEKLAIDVVAGTDFPSDLSPYDLIVHCGACKFNRMAVMARIGQARAADVPVTNYGILIALLTGVLPRLSLDI